MTPKAPDHIFISCPKCRKKLQVNLRDLAWQHFRCPNCLYTVTTEPHTLAVIQAAYDLWSCGESQ